MNHCFPQVCLGKAVIFWNKSIYIYVLLSLFNHSGNLKHYLGFGVRIWGNMAYIRDVPSLQRRVHMKKYQLLFKISAVFSYLFFVFGLSQLTLIVQNYWQFSSQIGNFLPRLAIFSGLEISWVCYLAESWFGFWLRQAMVISFAFQEKNGFGIRFWQY